MYDDTLQLDIIDRSVLLPSNRYLLESIQYLKAIDHLKEEMMLVVVKRRYWWY